MVFVKTKKSEATIMSYISLLDFVFYRLKVLCIFYFFDKCYEQLKVLFSLSCLNEVTAVN